MKRRVEQRNILTPLCLSTDYDDFDLLNKDQTVGGWKPAGNDFKLADFYQPWMASKNSAGVGRSRGNNGKSPNGRVTTVGRREGSGRKRKQTVFLNVGELGKGGEEEGEEESAKRPRGRPRKEKDVEDEEEKEEEEEEDDISV